jgi:hypothetical protein
MRHPEEHSLIFKIIQFALKKESEKKAFLVNDLFEELKINDQLDRRHVNETLIAWTGATNSNHILVPLVKSGTADQNMALRLNPSALFSYIDHLEIVEARKTAFQSKVLSWIAIAITLIIGGLQLIFQVVYR